MLFTQYAVRNCWLGLFAADGASFLTFSNFVTVMRDDCHNKLPWEFKKLNMLKQKRLIWIMPIQ